MVSASVTFLDKLTAGPWRIYNVVTEAVVRTRIIRIGNSRGVRLPKALIEQAGLDEDVVLHVRPGAIMIEAADRPRAGWLEAAARLAESAEDEDFFPATRFDEDEWQW